MNKLGYERLPIGIVSVDHDLRVSSANGRFYELFGCREGDVVGRMFESLLHTGDRKGTFRLHRALSSYVDGVSDAGLCAFKPTGRCYLVRLRFAGGSEGWTFYVEDVARFPDLCYDLTIRTERWDAMLSEVADAYAILDAGNRIVEFNAKFYDLMKYASNHGVPLSEEAVSLRDFTELPHEEPLNGFIDAVRAARAGAKDGFETTTWYKKRYINAHALPVHLPVKGYVGTVLVFRDLTGQAELERLRLKTAHYSGISEVVTGVVHNVGNVLNSLRISAESVTQMVLGSKVDSVALIEKLIDENRDRLADFFSGDPKGKALPEYCGRLARTLSEEKSHLLEELENVGKKLEAMRNIIDVQQNFAKGTSFTESIPLHEIVEDALNMQSETLARHGISVSRDIPVGLIVRVQKAKFTHVVMNLIINAKQAMRSVSPEDRHIAIGARADGNGKVLVTFKDNGEGIDAGHIGKIFSHGFTTRRDGHGFGLHFCATAMIEMEGEIRADSDGKGTGATMTLVVPMAGKGLAAPADTERRWDLNTEAI